MTGNTLNNIFIPECRWAGISLELVVFYVFL